jgi:glutamate N-acetyltransferase/amino-acid N-acetyltransferase
VLVASTGIIGHALPMERVEAGIRQAAAEAGAASDGPLPGEAAAEAIMTTDTRPKQIAVEFVAQGRPVRIGGIAKGAGMIAPHLATMLAFVTSDAAVWPEVLQASLAASAARTFNCVTVDGDTSTNDTLFLLANGASGVSVRPGSPAHRQFCHALDFVCLHLAKELARDGEGATKLIEVQVHGARSFAQAQKIGRTIANSPLVKTAFFGNDPNWGRILAAAGRAGVPLDPEKLALRMGDIALVEGGAPLPFDPAVASALMQRPEVTVALDLGLGPVSATVWTCDLSYDYVRINAEYHT